MHFLAMILFSLIVGIVFALLNSEITGGRARLLYGLKVFGLFVGIGLALAYLMYPFPR
ncbi:MAG TPA: hypothetical protein VFC63_07105 [Blastocatellia bacterium]|nr:hypothetical protein [Blastocatellia bacterium]